MHGSNDGPRLGPGKYVALPSLLLVRGPVKPAVEGQQSCQNGDQSWKVKVLELVMFTLLKVKYVSVDVLPNSISILETEEMSDFFSFVFLWMSDCKCPWLGPYHLSPYQETRGRRSNARGHVWVDVRCQYNFQLQCHIFNSTRLKAASWLLFPSFHWDFMIPSEPYK